MNFNLSYFKKSIIKESLKKKCVVFPKGQPKNTQEEAIPHPFG